MDQYSGISEFPQSAVYTPLLGSKQNSIQVADLKNDRILTSTQYF
jgi:hypothetical protein